MSPRRMMLPMAPPLASSMVAAAAVGLRRSKMPTITQATRCFSGLPLLTKYSMCCSLYSVAEDTRPPLAPGGSSSKGRTRHFPLFEGDFGPGARNSTAFQDVRALAPADPVDAGAHTSGGPGRCPVL